jgi:hypothetical protein
MEHLATAMTAGDGLHDAQEWTGDGVAGGISRAQTSPCQSLWLSTYWSTSFLERWSGV